MYIQVIQTRWKKGIQEIKQLSEIKKDQQKIEIFIGQLSWVYSKNKQPRYFKIFLLTLIYRFFKKDEIFLKLKDLVIRMIIERLKRFVMLVINFIKYNRNGNRDQDFIWEY
ncbi:unnamed protein product [Paramecium octaurelia]|uniref:Uncharacterized protein n=1 Tax=Paramecium octaurelia TaxID=43137 RepID=A0A8S1V0K5_PAROT|nr:unnamed protein product [Paramecium octaurelia]